MVSLIRTMSRFLQFFFLTASLRGVKFSKSDIHLFDMTEVTYCQMWWTCPTREELLKKPRGWELTFPWGYRGGIQQDLPVCKWSPDQSTLPNNEQGFQSTYRLLELFHCPHCHMTAQKPNFDQYAFYTMTKPAIQGYENLKAGWQLLIYILHDLE